MTDDYHFRVTVNGEEVHGAIKAAICAAAFIIVSFLAVVLLAGAMAVIRWAGL